MADRDMIVRYCPSMRHFACVDGQKCMDRCSETAYNISISISKKKRPEKIKLSEYSDNFMQKWSLEAAWKGAFRRAQKKWRKSETGH